MNEQKPAAIDRLLKKMDSGPGFAGLGESVQIISRLGDDVDCDTRQVAAAILHDAALTAKLLRIANSSRYARGGGNISTIDQVLAVMGLSAVKSVALSLALLDSLPHAAQSKQLHAEIVVANFCGRLAYEITRNNGSRFSAQEAQVCGLLQNLGRMMATYYLYDDIERSRQLQIEQNLDENEAVIRMLGVSFEEIGAAIAQHWELPDVLQGSLSSDSGETQVHIVTSALAWIQQCSSFCRRVSEILFRLPESRERAEIASVIEVFQRPLRLNEKEVREWIEKCLLDTDALLAEMSFPCNVEEARHLLRKGSERALDMISSQDSLVKVDKPGKEPAPIDLVKHILRLIHAHYGFEHTLICLPSGSSGLVAIAGVGKDAGQLTAKFRSGGIRQDIFRMIVEQKTDTFIGDINSPSYTDLIPRWYRDAVAAKSFVMLPLLNEGKLLGIIYGGYSSPRASAPSGLAEGDMLDWRNKLIQILKPRPQGPKRITLSIS